ncbi:NAD-dependent epimerase/dehydratase family protein [Gimesia panareensis]|uniref:NAD-dependent epimerase/dehydratase family protein n=1 Tax=Gimesia panareensis TaxID=2527978 RepID=UPI0011885682|nr:NAD-dependent epimerase/dehydratase family protein [Gimesia panareensis]QDU51823.1 dTDP-L-rhamnose 4-epimerase [Gimesia panareensis]
MAKKVLITGGAGFIGSRLAEKLADLGHEILVYDSLHPQVHGEIECFEFQNANIQFVRGDVCDKAFLGEQLEQLAPDIVYHMAAETGTGQSMYEICRYTNVNVQGTANLLEGINQAGTVKKVILPSSRSVYGEGAYEYCDGRHAPGNPRQSTAMRAGNFGVVDEEGNVLKPLLTREDLPVAPVSIYASTKLMQEYLCTQAKQDQPWNATILRFQNVYGPGQSLLNPYTGVLSIFSTHILNGGSLNIFEDGEIYRDFVFVDDVVDALVRCLDAEVPHGEVINIGSGESSSILEIGKILNQSYDKPQDNFYISGDFREGDIRYACADISKAGDLLGWKPRKTIEQGLAEFVDWAKSA